MGKDAHRPAGRKCISSGPIHLRPRGYKLRYQWWTFPAAFLATLHNAELDLIKISRCRGPSYVPLRSIRNDQ